MERSAAQRKTVIGWLDAEQRTGPNPAPMPGPETWSRSDEGPLAVGPETETKKREDDTLGVVSVRLRSAETRTRQDDD
jgi:hypothetical protein